MSLFLATLLLAASPPDAGATVTLPIEARVRGTEIRLGEVARVEGAAPEVLERLRAIELGYTPAPGYSRLLRADLVRAALEREAPGIELRLAGEPACRVWPEVDRVGPDELRAVAREALERVVGPGDATLQAGDVGEVLVPVGTSGRELVARLESPELASGVVSVPVEVRVDGAVYRTVWTTWEVEVFQTLPVLRRPVKAGETLAPELFERKRVRVETAGSARPLGDDALAGSVAAHDLAGGAVVTSLDVHRPTVVTQGQSLFLEVKKGGITARVSALALDSGSVGDPIRVRAQGSGQELSARVVGRDLARIELGP